MSVVLARRVVAELLGTAFLVMAVVGSGIAASRLSPDDVGLQLLENSLVTGAVFVALILALQPVSASFNPVVTAVERALGLIDSRTTIALVAAAAAMREEGIDITAEQPKVLTPEAVQASDVVVTIGCGDACPFFPGTRYEDWQLDDPAGQGIEAVRPIRDEIRGRVERLLADLLDNP